MTDIPGWCWVLYALVGIGFSLQLANERIQSFEPFPTLISLAAGIFWPIFLGAAIATIMPSMIARNFAARKETR
jgi:threonine/homoserine efflux transporter RhtA